MYMFEICDIVSDETLHLSGLYREFETVTKEYPELDWKYSHGQHTIYAETQLHFYIVYPPDVKSKHERVNLND